MRNCLRADFVRLFRSLFFWILIVLPFGSGMLTVFDGSSRTLDSDLLSVIVTIMLLGSIFAAFFIGTDYSDGTIRNKLIIGNSRAAVWFSNLIVCCAAAELMFLSILLPITVLGPVAGRIFSLTAEELFFRLLIENIALLALIALIVLITMLVKSRSSSIVIGTLLSFGLLLCAMVLEGRLTEPEYFQGMMYVDEDGNIQYDTETKEENPTYIRNGTARKVLEAVYDVLPSGQMLQMSSPWEEFDPAHGGLLLLYSAGIIAGTILSGVPTFQRGNLK